MEDCLKCQTSPLTKYFKTKTKILPKTQTGEIVKEKFAFFLGVLLTIVSLMKALDPLQHATKIAEFIEQLKSIDTDRYNYYEDLRMFYLSCLLSICHVYCLFAMFIVYLPCLLSICHVYCFAMFIVYLPWLLSILSCVLSICHVYCLFATFIIFLSCLSSIFHVYCLFAMFIVYLPCLLSILQS